ncbi:5' nucleotidase, NT5C type [Sinanaerobacter chloroacetimidivorans]|jgi:uncharacterized HAD superfamily protein|uniref:Nucleotidase n=1 Tax=Sinanaerobacter chloroacetimidivorans TaxID=2818044 RepID=A0A8J8B2F2_9FIRM|nr:hypothetical protein [Sinanaerobacter chloroacetimidivorans]MBR0598691.1 hypothetical protein [Sinanaerobacter chloroacetimidivorans]
MKKLNLCIDIDGTVTEPYYWLARVNDYFKAKLEPKDVTLYEIHSLLGIEEKEYDEFYQQYGELLHKEAKIRNGAQKVISRLFDHHEIHFVTAREEKMKEVSLEWFVGYKVPMDSISLLGTHNKVAKAEELNCDIFIEDRYENAIQLAEAGFYVLLVDCSYNKGILPFNVIRVKHWLEIEKLVQKRAFHLTEEKPA